VPRADIKPLDCRRFADGRASKRKDGYSHGVLLGEIALPLTFPSMTPFRSLCYTKQRSNSLSSLLAAMFALNVATTDVAIRGGKLNVRKFAFPLTWMPGREIGLVRSALSRPSENGARLATLLRRLT
jgi:hypothetical protein